MTASAADAFIDERRSELTILADTIVPADDFPSATASGALRFLANALDEREDWIPRAGLVLDAVERSAAERSGHPFADLPALERETVLDTLVDDEDYVWFARLVNAGYYGDPGNGGNDRATSWDMVGWDAHPFGGWPPVSEYRPAASVVLTPGALAPRYDAVVIGSGAGGGVAACGLAEAGRRVLVIETGAWPSTEFLAEDYLHNPRATWGFETRSGPPDVGNPRVFDDGRTELILRPSDLRWSNNAMTAGGGTRVYGAQAWRFGPDDFRMASRYGVPEGSALADWPFDYDELEPYYERAEWEIGVSGGDTDGAFAGPRARPRPMPPIRPGYDVDLLRAGADALGISTLPVPLLVNSVPYLGRPACVQCGLCVGFACPVDAKNGSQNTMLERAFATGNCSIILEATAERLIADARGRIVGVAIVGELDGEIWRSTVSAEEFVVAGGAVETPRLLLNSTSAQEPDGIGNNADQVGRYLQAHMYAGAVALAQHPGELRGPGPAIATGDFRQGNDGVVGGGILVNDFINNPATLSRYLSDVGLIPQHGAEAKRRMRAVSGAHIRLSGPIQEVSTADGRVRIDPSVTDHLGIPVARLSGSMHPEDVRARDFLGDKAAEWLSACDVGEVVTLPRTAPVGPSGGQHEAGTARMGTDPATSVTDPWGRVWGHDNVRVADGSVHVTNGGVNPALTIFANALRIVEHMAGGWQSTPR